MTQKLTHPDEAIFDDVENQTYSTGVCSVVTILWAGIAIMVAGILAVWYFVKPLNNRGQASSSLINMIGLSTSSPKISAPVATYFVTITEGELNKALALVSIAGVNGLTSTINDQEVQMKGTINKGFRVPIVVSFTPEVKVQGSISIRVNDVVLGGIRMNPIATDTVRDQLTSRLEELLNSKFSGKIKSIELQEKTLIAEMVP